MATNDEEDVLLSTLTMVKMHDSLGVPRWDLLASGPHGRTFLHGQRGETFDQLLDRALADLRAQATVAASVAAA